MAVAIWPKKLKQVKRITLDTMCFIYFLEANKRYGLLTKNLFSYLGKFNIKVFTSSITFAEILATSKVFNNPIFIKQYKTILQQMKNLTIYSVDLDIAEKAAYFRVHYGLKLPDAIQLATCFLSKSPIFITNDEKFRKVKEFKIFILKDFVSLR